MDSFIARDANGKKRTVTFSIRHELMEEAKRLGLNASQAAEKGLELEIQRRHAQAWLSENAESITSYNERLRQRGLLLTPLWARK